jgi:hypothetical protein
MGTRLAEDGLQRVNLSLSKATFLNLPDIYEGNGT